MSGVIKKSITIKNIDENEEFGVFYGYGSTYGNEDRDKDIMESGCFDKSLKKKSTYPMLLNHNWNKLIGKMECWTDEKGLKFKATLDMDDKESAKVYRLIKMGALDSTSVGFRVKRYEPRDVEKPYSGWLIKEADLYEVSVVVAPANEQATIDSIKLRKSIKSELENSYKSELENSSNDEGSLDDTSEKNIAENNKRKELSVNAWALKTKL